MTSSNLCPSWVAHAAIACNDPAASNKAAENHPGKSGYREQNDRVIG